MIHPEDRADVTLANTAGASQPIGATCYRYDEGLAKWVILGTESVFHECIFSMVRSPLPCHVSLRSHMSRDCSSEAVSPKK